MTQLSFPCPACQQQDKTYKVSLLYLEASARLNRPGQDIPSAIQHILTDAALSQADSFNQQAFLTGLVKTIEPPSGSRQVTRRLYPDLVVGVFTVIAGLLIYRMALDQPGAVIPGIGIFISALIAYLATRKKVIRQYTVMQQAEQADKTQVESEIARWMNLYYCGRDQVVFFPGHPDFAPVDQIRNFLRSA